MDYGVHSWTSVRRIGRAHALSADAADLLVPFMFIIWQSTIRSSADLSPFTIGVTVSGRNAGSYRVQRLRPGHVPTSRRGRRTCGRDRL